MLQSNPRVEQLVILVPLVVSAILIDAASAGEPGRARLPTQVNWVRRGTLQVIESGTGTAATLDVAPATVVSRVGLSPVELRPRAVFVSASQRDWTATIDPWTAELALVEGEPDAPKRRTIGLPASPQAVAATPDGRTVVVACDSAGRNERRIAFIDVETGNVAGRTIPGSSNLRGMAVDPQGKFVLAVHLFPKHDLPATQIEQGWVFTNAISYVPLSPDEPLVTLPLDLRTRAFANPEGIAISPDGARAWVAHAGADLVSVIDLPALVAVVRAQAGGGRSPASPGAYRADDLRLTNRYVRARIAVGANPRGIAVSRDGKFVAVANRLDDSVSVIDAAANSVVKTILLASDAAREDNVRRGEKLFHSGKLSLNGQFSCASCHPDGHTDGLNWDLPADGFNNFHNTKSLLGAAGTAPYGWTGASVNLRERFTGTLRHLFQHEPTAEESAALEAYLTQLDYPGGLPRRADPRSPAAERGRVLFQRTARCTACHAGPKLTDGKRHDVGTGTGGERSFDTPSLVRISETAPYLHDGRAETLAEIFATHNAEGQHGNAVELSPQQLADLVEFLKSL